MSSSVIVFACLFCILGTVLAYPTYEDDHHGPSHYHFNYDVSDPHTGDHKHQHEFSDGHVVKGSYSVAEPDGTHRIVEYTAGPHSGFNAIVKRVGKAQHPQIYHHDHENLDKLGGHGGFGDAQSHVGPTHWGS